FVASGSTLTYSTYLGGSGAEDGLSIAVNGTGNAYVAGATHSSDFPVANAIQWTNRGASDAFVAKLSATGSAFTYATYLGGTVSGLYRGEAQGNGMTLDGLGVALRVD